MKAFISYSHTDEQRRKRLGTHLAVLGREGRIEEWFDRKILAGSPVDAEIDERLEWCELFLPLVSPDFLASDYCYEREMSIALERHSANDARVVPIIIEPCDWRHTPLGELKAVPRDGKPVALWDNENHAFLDVVTELRRIVTAHQTPQTNLHGGAWSPGTVVGSAMRSTDRSLLGTVGRHQPPPVRIAWAGRLLRALEANKRFDLDSPRGCTDRDAEGNSHRLHLASQRGVSC